MLVHPHQPRRHLPVPLQDSSLPSASSPAPRNSRHRSHTNMSCCTGSVIERLGALVIASASSSELLILILEQKQRIKVVLLVSFAVLVIFFYRRLFVTSKRLKPYTAIPYPHIPEADRAQRVKVIRPVHVEGPLFQPPLSTRGRNIIDANGSRSKLVSINWYGASDSLFIPGGLETRHRTGIASLIRSMGFNSVRLPYSDEMVRTNPKIPDELLFANPDLFGARALDVFGAVVTALTDAGIAVIVNNHITQARWCCDGNLCDAAWSNAYLGRICKESQTENDWIMNWEMVMTPHVANPLVIGCDLRNEPRGLFGSTGWNLWATAAERLSERLLELQPNWLMIVEGTSSSNDLHFVRKRPVSLSIPNKLVYSSHVYGWSGWGQLDPYWGREYDSFAKDMRKNWAFLLEEDTAPVWLSEFGVPRNPNVGDMNYWKNLMRYMKETDVDWAYWAINPRKPGSNEFESYSILEDDWRTTVFDYRLCDMQKIMPDSPTYTT